METLPEKYRQKYELADIQQDEQAYLIEVFPADARHLSDISLRTIKEAYPGDILLINNDVRISVVIVLPFGLLYWLPCIFYLQADWVFCLRPLAVELFDTPRLVRIKRACINLISEFSFTDLYDSNTITLLQEIYENCDAEKSQSLVLTPPKDQYRLEWLAKLSELRTELKKQPKDKDTKKTVEKILTVIKDIRDAVVWPEFKEAVQDTKKNKEQFTRRVNVITELNDVF